VASTVANFAIAPFAVLLQEWLTPLQQLAMACVVAASVGTARTTSARVDVPGD